MHAKFLAGCLTSACFLAAGVATSSFAAEGPATITSTPAGRTVLIGGTTTFSVVADGTAPLSYQWRKAGQPISGAGRSHHHYGTVFNVETAFLERMAGLAIEIDLHLADLENLVLFHPLQRPPNEARP